MRSGRCSSWWGRAEDEQAVLAGSRVLFQRSRVLDPAQTVPFWALHPWTTQRYDHLRCLLYGSNPTRHAALLEDGGLSAALAQQCPATWQRQEQHWYTLLASHLRPAESHPGRAAPGGGPGGLIARAGPARIL